MRSETDDESSSLKLGLRRRKCKMVNGFSSSDIKIEVEEKEKEESRRHPEKMINNGIQLKESFLLNEINRL